MQQPEPETSLLTVILVLGFFFGLGYLLYQGIWRSVRPERWATPCPECGRHATHTRTCSQAPPACPDCGGVGDHRGSCVRSPRWRRIALLLLWLALVAVRILRWFDVL